MEELPLIQIPMDEYNRSLKASESTVSVQQKEKQRNKAMTAKRKSGGGKGPLAFLKSTNDWLEDVPVRIQIAYDNFIGAGTGLAQDQVDVICAWLAWKVNVAVERKRQTVLKVLHEQYQSTVGGKVMMMATVIQNFVSDPIGTVGGFAGAIFSPVAAVFKWVVELMSEILRLAKNLASIVSILPPAPPTPYISYGKFKLKVGSISMGEITSDPSSLPPPEVMFPEPEKPFSKETFTKSFEKASATLKSGRKKYMLSEEDRKTLSGFDLKASDTPIA